VARHSIDADAVQQVANQLGSLTNQIQNDSSQVKAQFSALQQAVQWTTVGAEDQLQQAIQQLANVENLLKDAQQRLLTVANDARQTEAAIQSS
jgi:uncharacterized phage infection (PIP) family protein YhgE